MLNVFTHLLNLLKPNPINICYIIRQVALVPAQSDFAQNLQIYYTLQISHELCIKRASALKL